MKTFTYFEAEEICDAISSIVYMYIGFCYTGGMKTDARSWSRSALREVRRKAIYLIEEGEKKAEIARKLGVSRQVIYKWWKMDSHLKFPETITDQRGKIRKLHSNQIKEIRQIISNHLPNEVGLPYLLWNIKAVNVLIQNNFGVKLQYSSVRRMLLQFNCIPFIKYDSRWYDYRVRELDNMSLYEYARKHNLQLYLLNFLKDYSTIYHPPKSGFVYTLSKGKHIEFQYILERRYYYYADFLLRLKKKSHRNLLVAYCSDTFRCFTMESKFRHYPSNVRPLNDVAFPNPEHKNITMVKIPYKYF